MDVKIKIYTTPSWPHCHTAKEFLSEKGVEFEAVDVTEDHEALIEMQEITNGGRSVPVIAIGDNVMVGFDPKAIEEALAQH